jgi:hypothetical protein
MSEDLENLIDGFVKDLIDKYESQQASKLAARIHILLTLEGNFALIKKLHRIERKELGYGTIVVPAEGFSEDDDVHNLIIDWLNLLGVNIFNVQNEIANLELALYS